jgi:hypothetical protein
MGQEFNKMKENVFVTVINRSTTYGCVRFRKLRKKQNYGFFKMDFRRRSARTSRRENAISEIIAENGLKCNF